MSKGKAWFYHFAIVKYDKTVALLILNMIKPYLSFYIFQVAMSQCACRCSIIRGKLEKNLLFQVKYLTSYSLKGICQNRLPKCE